MRPSSSVVEVVNEDPILTEGPVLPVTWSVDLLTGLDWRRLVEISRALAAITGHELGETTVGLDGAATYTMSRKNVRSIVRIAQWNRWMARRDCILSFAAELRSKRQHSGVYIAPLGFDLSAFHAAQEAGIQTVDAETLTARLKELPPEHSQFYYDVTTAGDAWTPSCPSCLKRLQKVEETSTFKVDCVTSPDVSYRTSDIVAEHVVARVVEVMKDCEVQFLNEVRAQDVVINGVVRGSFVCEGSLLMNPGAVLYGSVAARSVLVRPGAILHGKTRILQSKPEPMEKPPANQLWRCTQTKSENTCGRVSFLPH